MSADFFLFWDPVRVHDRQFSQDLTPVPDRHRPFSGGFERGQVQSFQKCLGAWKYGLLTVQPRSVAFSDSIALVV